MPNTQPTSVATSRSDISERPTKKRALTPVSQHSAQVQALFKNPDREINLSPASKAKALAAPPEIVTNVQGSSAGAGSGEFHVYKASRRREYERLRLMDEEVEREKADQEFERKREEAKRKEEEQLAKNRAKREKAKARKAKGKKGGAGMDGGDVIGEQMAAGGVGGLKRKLGPRKVADGDGDKDGTEGGDAFVKEDRQAGDEEAGGVTIHDDD